MHHQTLVSIPGKIAQIKNVLDMHFLSGLGTHLRVVALDYFHNTASHCTVSQNRNFNHNPPPLFSRQYFDVMYTLLGFHPLQHF